MSTGAITGKAAGLETASMNFAEAAQVLKKRMQANVPTSRVAKKVLGQSAETERKQHEQAGTGKRKATVIEVSDDADIDTAKLTKRAKSLKTKSAELEGHAGAFARNAEEVKEKQEVESKGCCISPRTLNIAQVIAGLALIAFGIFACATGNLVGIATISVGALLVYDGVKSLMKEYRLAQWDKLAAELAK